MASIEDRAYEAKLQNLRRHAPFLKGMIDKLRAQERTQQVSKLESLWSMITSNKRLKFETLQKCEDVMLKIQSKSQAGVNKQIQLLHKKSPTKSNQPDKNVAVIMNAVKLNIARAKLHNSVTPTPKSPTPDRDLPQHIPITIPMDKIDDVDEIASPDPDNDPAILWSETNENRYDSAKPDVYTNAVMHKPPEDKQSFEPPKPIIPTVNINTPPISMQDLQQLEDSIPIEKMQEDDGKKEPSAEEKLLKRPSKVSLVPAPIIKPKHKKDGDKVSNFDQCKSKQLSDSKKSHKERDSSKSTPESSKSQTTDQNGKEHKKTTESSSKHKSSSLKSSSHKSSHHSSDKPTIDKMSSTKHTISSSKVKDSNPKDCKSNPSSKSPRRVSIEDQTTDKDTIFGSLLSSIDNTLLTERDVPKKKVPSKPNCVAKLPFKPSDTNNMTSDEDKSNKTPVSDVSSKVEDKTVYKRLADKYNPRPKKKEPEMMQSVDSAVSYRSEETLFMNVTNKSNDIVEKPQHQASCGPPNLLHLRFSPPPESQFPQQQHNQFILQQQQQRRPFYNQYDQQGNHMAFNQQRSPVEYDLSKVGQADFYANKSPPFNNRHPEMNVMGQRPDAFSSWNNNNEAHDFQGRRLYQDHPRVDPRLSRQEMQPNIRFENNFDNRQCDNNRFFCSDDNNFVDDNRFMRPNDNNFEGNRFIRPENNINQDNKRFFVSNDNSFERQGDNNRFGRPADNIDRPRDCNRPFMPNDNRFIRPNDNDSGRQIENKFVRPDDNNRFIIFKAIDKPEVNRFAWTVEKKVPRHDDVNDKSFLRKDEPIRVTPKIEETNRHDPRLQRHNQQVKPKVEKAEPALSNALVPKKEVYDDLYSRINCKDKDERESFTSPLDSIYEKKQQVTGKGYGIQNFRIPKKPRPPPPVKCPTPPRKRSPSPPLRRPPTPPRKRRSPSPPMEEMPTPPPPPRIADTDDSDVPEIVAQLPESIRKDDRFDDVVTVLSSLLKDETALTKIKKLLTKETKDDSSSDDDEPIEKAVKQRKTKKLIKRQPKKQSTTAVKKSVATKKSSSVSVDDASTDTEPTQVRRSGRLRKRIAIFEDDDSEENDKYANKSSAQDQSEIECEPPLTDEQLDEIAACIDPFDSFLPDNEADQLVEEALKQPAEKLEEEINKQLVNDIFDSLKNEDNLDVPAEDTQKIIDSWGLPEANANKMIDSWDKDLSADLFDKEERDGDSQDHQQDVRNEIDELIKNMPLNDSDKILDCDIVKATDVVESTVKEDDKDELSKCDDAISSITKKLTEENSNVEKDVQPTSDNQTSGTKEVTGADEEVVKVNEQDIEEVIPLKPLQTRSLRSSPRIRPPVSYADDVKPRAKRGSKKQDADNSSPKKQEVEIPDKVVLNSTDNTKDDLLDEESMTVESATKEPEDDVEDEQTAELISGKDLSTSDNSESTNISPQDDVDTASMPSKEIANLDSVITELIAKYSVENKNTSTKINAKKIGKKPCSKGKRRVLPIRAVVEVKIEQISDDVLDEDSRIEVEEIYDKTLQTSTSPGTEIIADETSVTEQKNDTKNATNQIQDIEYLEITKYQTDTSKTSAKKSPAKKGNKKSTITETSASVAAIEKTTDKELVSSFETQEVKNPDCAKEKKQTVTEGEETCTKNESIIKPIETSIGVLTKDPENHKEIAKQFSSNKVYADEDEHLSVETSAVEKSPVMQKFPAKKRIVMKKRGRNFKLHPVKKKITPKPIVAPSASSEALIAIAKEATVVKKQFRPRRKRSELDKLHEDIKETMGDKVLTSKRNSTKSPRGAGEIEDSAKTDAGEDTEESEEEISHVNVKQATKALQSPVLRQKAKGLKVIVEQLPNKTLSMAAKKSKLRQITAARSEDGGSESDQDNHQNPADLSIESTDKQNIRKRKNRKPAIVRQNKKRKTNNKAIAGTTDKTTAGDTNGDSDGSDDVDTDYDVEFVEPDAEHYVLKGKPTKCRLCDFEGVTLVDHYVNNHRAGEVPVSRLPPDDSKLALQDAKENNYYVDMFPQNLLFKDNKKKKIRFTFMCRFCLQDFQQFSNVQFVDHIATHTGEYRHKCKGCDLKNASARFIKTHYMEVHGDGNESAATYPVDVIIPPPLNFHTVFGYMCTECHFVQLSYRSVTEHIQIYHLDESATAIKISMSLADGHKKDKLVAKEADTMETGVFTSHDDITEEELQREEANRTEMMKEVHKETQDANNRLNSVAALLKNRLDASLTTVEEHAGLEQSTVGTNEVARLPKAKPKDIKPNFAELQQAVATAVPSDVNVVPQSLSGLKYTIFIIGPLKAVVTHSNRTVDFACITDDCVFYTTDRDDMAQHCRTAHGNRCERIRCGYCAFVGNVVPLVEVFEHICATHVDPLLVKEEPMEKALDKELVREEGVTAESVTENSNVEETQASPSPPRLPFMGNHFGIKIVSVSGGVLDDIVPSDEPQQAEPPSIDDRLDESSDATVTVLDTSANNGHLPQLMPISEQSPSVLKKLSSLQKQTSAKMTEAYSSDGIFVSKVDVKSNHFVPVTTSHSNTTPKIPSIQDYSSSKSKLNDCESVLISDTLTTSIDQEPTPLLIDDDDDDDDVLQPEEHIDNEMSDVDVDDPQQVLALLAKVSTFPEDSAMAPKRRFHTGKTDFLYRCPDSKCGFASETRKEFELHLRSIGGGHSDLQRAYRCVYCYTTLPLEQYSAHLIYYHGTSEFGCSRCCYRAVAPYYIQLHKNSYHTFDHSDVMLLPLASDVCKTKVEEAMMEYTASKIKSLIKPFSCYCGERFIVTANYSCHLEKNHRCEMAKKGIDCRDCQMKGGKNMISHYAQVHNNHLYHCTYCSFGADMSAADVFTHQSARHPGMHMEVIVRTVASESPSQPGTPFFNNKNEYEDETVWSKIVRLTNPQANKDLDIIQQLRDNSSKGSNIPQQDKPPKKQQPQNPRSIQQKPTRTNDTIETIDLVVLSPEPIEPPHDNSILTITIDVDQDMQLTPPEDPNLTASSPAMIPPRSNTPGPGPISPRCATPTNQPIVSPSIGSNMTTPDEDIFVVLQPSSDVPLAGSDLFVCAQCGIHCTTSGVFRAHVHDCVKVDREANSKPYGCAHCDRRCKTSTALLDHMRAHGFPRYRCGLCDFKHTQPWNVRTHMRTEHNISTCVQVPAHPNKLDDDFDDFIYRPRQSQLAPPAHLNPTQPPTTQVGAGQTKSKEPARKDRTLSASSSSVDGDMTGGTSEVLAPLQRYLPTEVGKLPMRAVYTTEVGCALCEYKSKVRTNIIRHLNLHIDGLAPSDLPTTACVNPVPCLDRDELMFDKMANLAYNSHQADVSNKPPASRMGGPASMKLDPSIGDRTKDDGRTKVIVDTNVAAIGPQYVPRSKRYVCGALECNYQCHDEITFRRHIQALHSHWEVSYRCRHCTGGDKVTTAPAMMNVELVLRHLRLHGNTLYKCTHCPFMHNMRSIIDRHITERHMEKNIPNLKVIITIRDIPEESDEDDSLSSTQNSTSSSNISSINSANSSEQTVGSKPAAVSAKDAKPWRCAMCKVRCVAVEDIVNHTTNKHKIGKRYKCGYCDYSNDDRDSYIPHFATHHPDSPTPDIITIYFHSPATTTLTQTATTTASSNQSTADNNNKDNSIGSMNESSDGDQSSSFDTTPLWRKPATGDVRHIRGILLETRGQHSQYRREGGVTVGREGGAGDKGNKGAVKRDHRWIAGTGVEVVEDGKEEKIGGQSGSPPKKQSKAGNQTPTIRVTKPRGVKSILPSPQQPQKRKPPTAPPPQNVIPLDTLVISIPVDLEIRIHNDSCNKLRLVDVNNLSISKMLIQGNLGGKFGEYGRPTERGYMCPKCTGFETNGERQFLAHLFREISYMRYKCERCNTRTALAQSVYLRCPAAPPNAKPPRSDCIINSLIDIDKEQWALMVLAVQTRIAAHLTANGLWEMVGMGGLAINTGAGAVMRGLKLAYDVRGKFNPTEIFPKSPATRFSVISKTPVNSDQPNIDKPSQFPTTTTIQQPINSRQSNHPLRNISSITSSPSGTTPSIEDDLPITVIERDVQVAQSAPKQQLLKNNVLARVQSKTAIAQMAPVLMNKPHQRLYTSRIISGSKAGRVKEVGGKFGIQMFPEVVTVVANSDKDVELIDDNEDDDDDDDVEIIDPLVDTVDLDAADVEEISEVKESAASSVSNKDTDSIPVDSVTVSSFLPTIGDIDPLLDETSYSDNDSIALEIAEDDYIDEEVEPQAQVQLNPIVSLNTSASNLNKQLPIKNTAQKNVPIVIKEETLPPTTNTFIKIKSIESLSSSTTTSVAHAKDQEEQVSSTTSDVPVPGKGSNATDGTLGILTPLDPSLVGRLRVIGDASMVGCFGLSSGVQMSQQQDGLIAAGAADVGIVVSPVVAKATLKQLPTHKCKYCTFRSNNVHSLRKHELRHWAEKPYRCGFLSPTGSPCNFQNHFRNGVFRHIRDVHGSLPEEEVPIIHVKITNPTIVVLRGQKSNVLDSDQSGTNSATNSTDGSPSTPAAKRLRLLDSSDNTTIANTVPNKDEEFEERYTCPSCTFTSNKARYVQQHLRLHVKCIKCRVCNQKDSLRKRLRDKICPLFHKTPSMLDIEYDNTELDRLKGQIQQIMVPKSSLQALDQNQSVDDDDDNEFLEIYKTVRNYPSKQIQRKQQQQQQQQSTNQLASQQLLTTFDVATSTYMPLQEQSQMSDVANTTLYEVHDTGTEDVDGTTDAIAGPIVLNSLMSQPRLSNINLAQLQQQTARKSTGGLMLNQLPLYVAPNFYTASQMP